MTEKCGLPHILLPKGVCISKNSSDLVTIHRLVAILHQLSLNLRYFFQPSLTPIIYRQCVSCSMNNTLTSVTLNELAKTATAPFWCILTDFVLTFISTTIYNKRIKRTTSLLDLSTSSVKNHYMVFATFWSVMRLSKPLLQFAFYRKYVYIATKRL